jgi:hypothetical protein
MPRPRNEFEAIGNDSFLDVVTNTVGILIILVMVIGIRVQNLPPPVQPTPDPVAGALATATAAELTRLKANIESLERRALDMQRQSQALDAETAAASEDRLALGRAAALARAQLDEELEGLDAESRSRFDLERSLDETESSLNQARNALDRALADRESAATVDVISYHTPIGRTVNGPEIHFQLRGDRIAYVAKDDLEQALVRESRERAASVLRGKRQATIIVGPIGDYRLRANLRRVDRGVAIDMGAVVSSVELVEYTLVPIAPDVGEPAATALDPSSEFWARVTRANPQTATITLWTYPDAYSSFRRLKKELYERGYAVACRMLPPGHPIGGSPQGSKSVRQ